MSTCLRVAILRSGPVAFRGTSSGSKTGSWTSWRPGQNATLRADH